MSEPSHLCFSTVSPSCWRPWLLSFVLWGVPLLPVLTIFTSPCLQRTTLYIEFPRHVLDTSPVRLLSVSCHSVHTDLFRVPRGCFTCKDFVFPSVMCPQCPVFRVLVPCSTHFHSASLKTSPWAKVAPWCPSTGDTHCHLWSVFLCEGRHSVSMAVRPCEAVCVVSTQVLLPAPPCPEHW